MAQIKRPVSEKVFRKQTNRFKGVSYFIAVAAIPLLLTSLAYQSAYIYGTYLPWQDVVHPPESPPVWQIIRYVWINISIGVITALALHVLTDKEKARIYRAIIVTITVGAVGMGLALLNHQLGVNVWAPVMALGPVIVVYCVWLKMTKRG